MRTLFTFLFFICGTIVFAECPNGKCALQNRHIISKPTVKTYVDTNVTTYQPTLYFSKNQCKNGSCRVGKRSYRR